MQIPSLGNFSSSRVSLSGGALKGSGTFFHLYAAPAAKESAVMASVVIVMQMSLQCIFLRAMHFGPKEKKTASKVILHI